MVFPFIGVIGARPNDGLTFDTTLELGGGIPFPGYPKLSPPEDPKIVHIKNIENPVAYTLTIGTETYYLNTDFNYDGINWGKQVDGIMTLKVRYSYDFSPAGIDGTLEMTAQLTADMTTVPWEFSGWIRGHGTGELRGAIVVAEPVGFTHSGMIYNWPL